MTTRLRSSSRCAGFVALAIVGLATPALAQTPAAEETALRDHYGVAHWSTSATRAGVTVARVAVPGLQLRGRTDHASVDGGVALLFGGAVTTLRVRIAVAPDTTRGREALVGFLRATQAYLVPLADLQGADVALGNDAAASEAAVALYGNVAIAIERTREAGPETPPARDVLRIVRAAIAGQGPASPTPVALRTNGGHVTIVGSAVEHVEVVVRGGHLRGAATPGGFDVVADRAAPVDVRVVCGDALGRTQVVTGVVGP